MSDAAKVLLVDDDTAVLRVLSSLLGQAGMHAVEANSAEQALHLLDRRLIDVVVTDLRMPGMDGMTLLHRLAQKCPGIPVIMLTAHGSIPLAVDAMKAGAADFLLKPFDRDEVLFVINKALLASSSASTAESPSRHSGTLIGESPTTSALRDRIRRAATGNATVLIRGETGTGKELVARAIHESSPRKSQPFVKLNCASLPEALLESELFGYERGAFTGAAARKPGRVELAQRGTLFLDEIGDVPLPAQVKLLRMLQEREIERVGGTETIRVDVRFLAATHRDLEGMIAEGEFREDLFYRLNVVPIDVPPLRDRADEIPQLALHFVAVAREANGKKVEIHPAAIDLLSQQRWKGNVRQLENFVERLVVLSDGSTIVRADVERELASEAAREGTKGILSAAIASAGAPLGDLRRNLEREAIIQALAHAGNNRSLAARILGVSRRTLYNKLEELGVP